MAWTNGRREAGPRPGTPRPADVASAAPLEADGRTRSRTPHCALRLDQPPAVEGKKVVGSPGGAGRPCSLRIWVGPPTSRLTWRGRDWNRRAGAALAPPPARESPPRPAAPLDHQLCTCSWLRGGRGGPWCRLAAGRVSHGADPRTAAGTLVSNRCLLPLRWAGGLYSAPSLYAQQAADQSRRGRGAGRAPLRVRPCVTRGSTWAC